MYFASFVPETTGTYLSVLIDETAEAEFRPAFEVIKMTADFANCMRES